MVVIALMIYSYSEFRRTKDELRSVAEVIDVLRAENAELNERTSTLESKWSGADESGTFANASCDTQFPAGLYRLSTDTSYGPGLAGAYEIYNVSLTIAEWRVNVGTRLNTYAIPTEFYVDYDGDGRIDTALAARFAREIPVVGNTIADRLLADSRVHQNLYNVFSCEWRNAAYTSSDDMSSGVSGSSSYVWDLVQKQSEDIVEWIEAL